LPKENLSSAIASISLALAAAAAAVEPSLLAMPETQLTDGQGC